ncbi:MAG: 3-deoxy-manno-octulosonate cytidylyltransferase [Rikenellaceae bacterium]
MRVLAIIPARYASTRFPGKPLAQLGGVSVIERVYRQVSSSVADVVVATDDVRIFKAVESFGGRVVMTSESHTSGTDRCYEAYTKVAAESGEFDIVVNVQGDEPFIKPEQIALLVECFERDADVDIATLVKPFEVADGLGALENPNTPKVVIDSNLRAIYFSRSVIPYLRGVAHEEWLMNHTFYKHIGMYGFRAKALKEVTALPQSSLERAESLEQLRWLENGYQIGVGVTDQQTIGIDTPDDLEAAEQFLAKENK